MSLFRAIMLVVVLVFLSVFFLGNMFYKNRKARIFWFILILLIAFVVPVFFMGHVNEALWVNKPSNALRTAFLLSSLIVLFSLLRGNIFGESLEIESISTNFDDLKKIEGIGPKIEEILNEAGIDTFRELSNASYDTLHSILRDAGPRFKIHDPKTWSEQAKLASDGKWKELEKYQDFLLGGV